MEFFELNRSYPDDDHDVTRVQVSYDWNSGISMFDVFRGRTLTADYLSSFTFECDMTGDLYDCLPGNFSWLMLSRKMIGCIKGIKATGWDAHDLHLEKAHPDLAGYALLTSHHCLPTLDLERSELRWSEDRRGRYISSWGKLVLTEKPETDIFAMEGLPFFLCASQRVKEVWSDFGVTGIGYKPMHIAPRTGG